MQPDHGRCLGARHDRQDLGFAGLQCLPSLLQGRGVHAILDGRHDAGYLAFMDWAIPRTFAYASRTVILDMPL